MAEDDWLLGERVGRPLFVRLPPTSHASTETVLKQGGKDIASYSNSVQQTHLPGKSATRVLQETLEKEKNSNGGRCNLKSLS